MITLIIVLLVVGFILWIFSTLPIPIDPTIKRVIYAIVIFCLCIYVLLSLLDIFGIYHMTSFKGKLTE